MRRYTNNGRFGRPPRGFGLRDLCGPDGGRTTPANVSTVSPTEVTMASDTSAREEFRAVLRRHEAELDADDLRDIAADLEKTADNWEGIAL